jgi:Domain of unknown function (DUF1877)
MRRLIAAVCFFLVVLAPPAHAGVSLFMVMVSVEDVPALEHDEEALGKLVTEDKRDSTLDVDKAFHGIHFLLNGNASSTGQ